MTGLFQKFSDVITPLAGKLGSSRHLNTLRDAFMLAFPITFFGSMMVVLMNLPFLDSFMSEAQITSFRDALRFTQLATVGVISVYVSIGVGYFLSKSYDVDPVFGAVVALTSFLFVTPFSMSVTVNGETGVIANTLIPMQRLGAQGLFVAMLSAIFAVEIYRRVVQKGWVIKMPDGVPPTVSKSFSALIPASVTLLVVAALNILVVQLSGTNIHDIIFEFVQRPLVGLGRTLPATLFTIFIAQLLWFFGLHGQVITRSVMDPVWQTLSQENLYAFTNGLPLPNIVTFEFISIFHIGLGGSGMTLGAVIAVLLFSKSRQMRQVASMAAPAGVFNVNEPVVFGFPIVMNPIFFIPWIFAPIVAATVGYIGFASGLVPRLTGVQIPWSTPFFINGILATNSVLGGILQLVMLAIATAIWLPFILIADKMALKAQLEAT